MNAVFVVIAPDETGTLTYVDRPAVRTAIRAVFRRILHTNAPVVAYHVGRGLAAVTVDPAAADALPHHLVTNPHGTAVVAELGWPNLAMRGPVAIAGDAARLAAVVDVHTAVAAALAGRPAGRDPAWNAKIVGLACAMVFRDPLGHLLRR